MYVCGLIYSVISQTLYSISRTRSLCVIFKSQIKFSVIANSDTKEGSVSGCSTSTVTLETGVGLHASSMPDTLYGFMCFVEEDDVVFLRV